MTHDIICVSHLRWDFVYQRPQHLMNLLAQTSRVFYIEEPVFNATEGNHYFDSYDDPCAGVHIIVPHLPPGSDMDDVTVRQQNILKDILWEYKIERYITWYYSPMAWSFSRSLKPDYIVYDCMDELSAFLFAPPELRQNERALLTAADAVFTGGRSLFAAKRKLHDNIHCFPSSIDKDHFCLARNKQDDPGDQQHIPHPRIGFYGVIDERLNIALLDEIAAARPSWQLILIGPVVKIDPATLPQRPNIHYLGPKQYTALPCYLSGWDIAMMPFALNASTEFISPTKTPEYLAGGKPVISPSIADVVAPYGELGLVSIADDSTAFIRVADDILLRGMPEGWLKRVDEFLSHRSWQKTVGDMICIINRGLKEKQALHSKNKKRYV